MPITPYHFGPGAVIHAVAPKKISFIGFCVANVIIDIEPLYYMLTNQDRLHRFFHTYIGATLVALITCALFVTCRWFAKRFWLPNPLKWQDLSLISVLFGASLGTYSHIVLDSIMHSDITPFAPFSNANPLLQIISLSALHWFCLGSGAAGAIILEMRNSPRK